MKALKTLQNYVLRLWLMMHRRTEKQYLVSIKEKMVFGHSIAKQAVKEDYMQVIYAFLAGRGD